MHKRSLFLARAFELIRKPTQMLSFPICSLHDVNVPFCCPRGSQMWGSFTVVLGMQLLVELGANVLACWGC